MSRPTTTLGATSNVDVDANSVFRLLLAEHRDALSGARLVLANMLTNQGVRDLEGLEKLERLLSLVKASASYLGLSLLREVVVEAERVVDRLQLPGTKQGTEPVRALEQALDFIAASLTYARSNQRTEGHEERGRGALSLLSACALTPVSVLPDQLTDQELFAEEARCHVELCREAVVRAADDVDARSEALHAAFRAMHTLKGNAAMMGFGELEGLGRAAEQALDGLRDGELTLTGSVTIALLNLLDKAGIAAGRPTAFHWHREAEALDVACAEARIVARRTRIGALLVEHNYVSREQVELVLAIKREPLGEALILLHALSDKQLNQALDLQRKLRAGEQPSRLPTSVPVESKLQIDADKLRRLQRRVDDMRRAVFDGTEEAKRAVLALSGVVETLDHVPLDRAFRRAALLMRDLAEKQNKKLVLTVHGEGLEVDRQVSSAISAALLHLGRNAVDHGLEYEIERVASGKSETARISLLAREEQDELVVELIDDGRGLSREAILAKALERGLVDLADTRRLSDEQVFSFIFLPGFSTAQRLTDISGRGVGMDAVKHSIEALGGRVTISSEPPSGTRVALRMPRKTTHETYPSAPPDLMLPDDDLWKERE